MLHDEHCFVINVIQFVDYTISIKLSLLCTVMDLIIFKNSSSFHLH